MKNIGIIGCGWLGERIAKCLQETYKIFATTTSKQKQLEAMGYYVTPIAFSDDETQDIEIWKDLELLDVIIIAVPFSKKASKQNLQNRVSNICTFIRGYEKQLFLMSSIGIYPQKEIEITEKSFDDEDLQPNLLFVEKLVRSYFPQVHLLRLGGLMGDDRFLSKYHVSHPYQRVNHIHYSDVSEIIKIMINKNLHSKTYNIVAPHHPTKREILNRQKNEHFEISETSGRIISSELMTKELSYRFIMPNPLDFDFQ